MTDAFHWIGIAVTAIAGICLALFIILRAYFSLIHGRFGAILFRKSPRRLSIASWHRTRLVGLSNDPEDTHHNADDWVVNERPFYLSYEVLGIRLFILAGTLKGPRYSSIRGEHP